MRYIVTPEFSRKLSSLSADGVVAIGSIVKFIEGNDKESFISGGHRIEIRDIGKEIYTIKYEEYRVYTSFGSDEEGEYLLLLDVTVETSKAASHRNYFSVNDPKSNMMLNPNSNMTIDPRRNMMVDPNRNMMIDPHRNMMIDPNRNMMIDPNRNMMIDPLRNMMIDPNRNMMIDPKRNTMIDPRRNKFYGGPYSYSTNLEQTGFLVRANEKVILFFDMAAKFVGFGVESEQGNMNIFDTNRSWIGYLVKTDSDVLLRFDTSNRWLGIVV